MDGELVIHGVEFPPEGGGLVLHYGRWPADVRTNGLIWTHTVQVPAGSDYDDELEAVTDALQALLVDVLDDIDRVPPVDPTPQEEEEDDDDDA